MACGTLYWLLIRQPDASFLCLSNRASLISHQPGHPSAAAHMLGPTPHLTSPCCSLCPPFPLLTLAILHVVLPLPVVHLSIRPGEFTCSSTSHTPCSHRVKNGFGTPVLNHTYSLVFIGSIKARDIMSGKPPRGSFKTCPGHLAPEYWDQLVTNRKSFLAATRRACQDLSNEQTSTLLRAQRVYDTHTCRILISHCMYTLT